MIGSRMYLVTWTRPDLAFSLSYLSHLSSHPLPCLHTAVNWVSRDLAGTTSMSLKYKHSPTSVPLSIVTYLTLIMLRIVIPVRPYLVLHLC